MSAITTREPSKATRQKPSKAARRKPSKVPVEPAVGVPDRRGAETRIAIRGVEWKVYDVLSDAVGEGSHVRVAYDGKDLEIMTKGQVHEYFRDLFGQFVNEVCNALRIRKVPTGEATWKRPEILRGIEADQSYYFQPEKVPVVLAALKRRSMDIADYPNPDMAVEIDISPPQVDREGIYKSLKVAEIWRFDGEDVTIEQLREDGTYAVAEMSRFLPVKAVEIRRWILEEDSERSNGLVPRLRAWLRRISSRRKPAMKRPRRRKKGG